MTGIYNGVNQILSKWDKNTIKILGDVRRGVDSKTTRKKFGVRHR
jgi:DNA replication protein DnaD